MIHHDIIGLIGGFGGYATLDFYRRLLETFHGESERDFPHIIIDNDFTMPSRTRCLLTGEGYEEIVNGITKSMKLLIHGGANHIVLVCGTAHYFLDDVYKKIPEAKKYVLDIIDITGEYYAKTQKDPLFIMAAEGTLEKKIYPHKLKKNGIECFQPLPNDYPEIRFFVECVKQNEISEITYRRFSEFINKYKATKILLGCTELPVLVNSPQIKEFVNFEKIHFYNPLEYVLKHLVATIK